MVAEFIFVYPLPIALNIIKKEIFFVIFKDILEILLLPWKK